MVEILACVLRWPKNGNGKGSVTSKKPLRLQTQLVSVRCTPLLHYFDLLRRRWARMEHSLVEVALDVVVRGLLAVPARCQES